MTEGIHTDISIKDYHAAKGVSATGIKLAKKSLSLWRWWQTHPQEWKQHFDFGNAAELALLDKEVFKKEVAILQTKSWTEKADEAQIKKTGWPYAKPKASAIYKAEESKFEAENEGKYLIPDVGPHSFEYIEYMLESCYKDSVIQKLISGIEYQLSLCWTHDETGLLMRARPDICKRKKNVIVNLKTTDDGSPKEFARTLANYDYPLQAAVEIMGCLRTGLMPAVDNYFWLVLEKLPPFNATIYEFQKQDIEYAFDELDYVLRKIAKAEKEKLYPGYTDRAENEHGILTAEIPMWYKTIYH